MLNSVTITPVESNKELNKFICFPYRLYKNNTSWVPPLLISQKQLINKKHLFWQRNPHQFYLAFKEGRCVGRIAAFINEEHNAFHKTSEVFFGFLEAENDKEIFQQLLSTVEIFARENHCAIINGPMNPSLHYELGILTNGFEYPPYFMLTHNFSYYEEHILSSGYSKLKDFYSYILSADQYNPTEKMMRVNTFLKNRYKINIRNAEIKSFDKELDIFYTIYNNAFIGHWGFTPMQKDEFRLLAKDLKAIIDPRIILIAEMNDEPVAFLLCLPNYNEVFIKIKNGRLFPFGIFKMLAGQKKIRSIRVITAAVKKSHEHLGLGALLYPEIMKRGLLFNYHVGELSWVVEDNFMMNQVAIDLGAIPYKTYRVYSKELQDE